MLPDAGIEAGAGTPMSPLSIIAVLIDSDIELGIDLDAELSQGKALRSNDCRPVAEMNSGLRTRVTDPDSESVLLWRCLRCSTCVGLPLDPNVNTPGIRFRSSGVQVRLERKALAVTAASHLLLRVESNGSRRHRRVAPPSSSARRSRCLVGSMGGSVRRHSAVCRRSFMRGLMRPTSRRPALSAVR
jgi:hypothetical protein